VRNRQPILAGRRAWSLKRPRRSGLGLVELLIALSISAALLTAVAVTTDASFKAYDINEEQSNLMQRARLTVHRLLTYVRTCKEHQPLTPAMVDSFTLGYTVTDVGLSMFSETGAQLDFEYDAANKRVLLTENGTSRVLLRGVEAFQVKLEPMRSAAAIKSGGGCDLLKRCTVLLTIKTSGQSADVDESTNSQTITLSSSVMPRRNSW
jgi:hypothetical protein